MNLIHKLSGNVGVFVREAYGRYGYITIIKLSDGGEYFAPSNEFEEYRLITSDVLKLKFANMGNTSLNALPFGVIGEEADFKIKNPADFHSLQ